MELFLYFLACFKCCFPLSSHAFEDGLTEGKLLRLHKLSCEEIQRVVDTHNKLRDAVGDAARMNCLSWNPLLALEAEQWAGRCTTRHPRSKRLAGFDRVSGNVKISIGNRGIDYEADVRSWADGTLLDSSSAAEQMLNYIQLHYADSTDIGCAVADCDEIDGEDRPGSILFCYYGNGVDYNEAKEFYPKGRPCSECKSSQSSCENSKYRNLCCAATPQNTTLRCENAEPENTSTKKLLEERKTSSKIRTKRQLPVLINSNPNSATTSVDDSCQQKDDLEKFHNDMRASITDQADMQCMRWNDALAQAAVNVSQQCNVTEKPQAPAISGFTSVGVNYITTQNNATLSFSDAIIEWYAEPANCAVNSLASCTDDYKQLINAQTNQVGCAFTKCSTLTGQTTPGTLFICLYSVVADLSNALPYTQGAKCTQCPQTAPLCQVLEYPNLCCNALPTNCQTSTTTRFPGQVTPSPTQAPTGCQDNQAVDCQRLVQTQTCSNQFVATVCQRSCNLCPDQGGSGLNCIDRFVNCTFLNFARYCTDQFVRSACAYTCRACPGMANAVNSFNTNFVNGGFGVAGARTRDIVQQPVLTFNRPTLQLQQQNVATGSSVARVSSRGRSSMRFRSLLPEIIADDSSSVVHGKPPVVAKEGPSLFPEVTKRSKNTLL